MVYNENPMRMARGLLLLFLVGCATAKNAGEGAGAPPLHVSLAKRLDPLCCAGRDTAGVTIDQGKLVANGKALTPEFKAIESFDVSVDRREIVFSAKRDTNFDIGLVSLDGSDVHWIPADVADEIDPQWSVNRISYIVRRPGGDLIRTVHVPTAMALSADFPYTFVRSFKWDATGDRYSVLLTSPDASDRIDTVKYDGTLRKNATPPDARLDIEIEPIDSGIIVRPALLHYNEKLPLVIWVASNPLEWNDARAALMKTSRVAIAIVKQPSEQLPQQAFLDTTRVYCVCGDAKPAYSVVAVPHADVESSAAGWLAQQLKEPR